MFSDESSEHSSNHEEEGVEEYSTTIREVVEGLPYPQEPVNGVETSPLASSFLQTQGQAENGEAEVLADEEEEADVSPVGSVPQGAVARTPTTPSSPSEESHQGNGESELTSSLSHICWCVFVCLSQELPLLSDSEV